jgi:flagellar motor switch protein FliM
MAPFSIARRLPSAPPTKSIEVGGIAGRAPQLKECAERLVKSIVKSLQTMAGTATTIEGKLAGSALRLPQDVLMSPRSDTVMGSIVIKELSCIMLVMLDSTLVHSIVELLCGGNGVEPQPNESRTATAIDQQFAQMLVALAASAIQTEWAERGFVSARSVKLEGFVTPDIFGPRVEDVGVFDLTIGIFGLHGTLRFILPPVALERFGEMSAQSAADSDADPSWMGELKRELEGTPVSLAAYLDAKAVPLNMIAKLAIGQVLPLPADIRNQVALAVDGSILYRGELGRDDTCYSIRIEDSVVEPTSFKLERAPTLFVQTGT